MKEGRAMAFTIDREYLIETLADLVRIDSTNPSLTSSGAGEAEIAAYVADSFGNIGLDMARYEPQPGRMSVVGTLKGNNDGRSLMLNAHTDTVGVEGMKDPFSASIRDGKMYGRGAYDMKGSLAACLATVKALKDSGAVVGGDIHVAAVADEEYASIGTADLIERYRIHGAIVTEPTNMDICLAHKGFVWLEVETIGRAAHGSRFDEGIDANMRMGRFLVELEKLEQDLRARQGHSLVGPPSLHAAKISGGTELSTYSAKCNSQIERRTIPGETEAQIVDEIKTIIDKLASDDPTFKATLKPFFVRDPFVISPQASIVTAIEKAAEKVLDRKPAFVGQTGWMDSGLLSKAGIETVVMGPIGGGAHSQEEWVDLDSLVELAHILVHTALDYCK